MGIPISFLPANAVFLAALSGDLFVRLILVCVPVLLDAMLTECVLEPAECSLPCDGAKQVTGNLPVLDRGAETLHDSVFVYVVSGGKWDFVAIVFPGQELGCFPDDFLFPFVTPLLI
jgi:hypothetical protein